MSGHGHKRDHMLTRLGRPAVESDIRPAVENNRLATVPALWAVPPVYGRDIASPCPCPFAFPPSSSTLTREKTPLIRQRKTSEENRGRPPCRRKRAVSHVDFAS